MYSYKTSASKPYATLIQTYISFRGRLNMFRGITGVDVLVLSLLTSRSDRSLQEIAVDGSFINFKKVL